MGVEGEHSKLFIPGEAGEGESKLEQPGPSCQSSLNQRANTRNTVAALSRGGLGHEKTSKKSQPCHSSLHPRGNHLVVVPASEAAHGDETGFLGDPPRAVQLQQLIVEGCPRF